MGAPIRLPHNHHTSLIWAPGCACQSKVRGFLYTVASLRSRLAQRSPRYSALSRCWMPACPMSGSDFAHAGKQCGRISPLYPLPAPAMGPNCSAFPRYCVYFRLSYEWHRIAWHYPVTAFLPDARDIYCGRLPKARASPRRYTYRTSVYLHLACARPSQISSSYRRCIPACPAALASPTPSRQRHTAYPISNRGPHSCSSNAWHYLAVVFTPAQLHLGPSARPIQQNRQHLVAVSSRGAGLPEGTPSHMPYRLSSGHRVAPSYLKHGITSLLQTYAYLMAT